MLFPVKLVGTIHLLQNMFTNLPISLVEPSYGYNLQASICHKQVFVNIFIYISGDIR